MTDLYQYITLLELQERRDESLVNPSQSLLRQAQQMIDQAIPTFYEGINSRSFKAKRRFNNATFSTNSVTISDSVSIDNYYQRCVVRVLTGTHSNKLLFVTASTNNVLTVEDGIVGSGDIFIYQHAKFPREVDTIRGQNRYDKFIPEFLKDAVVMQYNYLEAQGGEDTNHYVLSEYRVEQDRYSEKFATDIRKTALDRLAPSVVDILENEGILANSIR